MFRFANPYYLYLLILIIILLFIYLYNYYSNKKRLKEFGDVLIIKELMPDLSIKRKHIKFSLYCISLSLTVLILARPQFGTQNNNEEKNGIEIIIATDVSNSMLCRDVTPSRIEKAKMILGKLIDQSENDRIGLVAFAGSAMNILPITSDCISAKTYLSQMSPTTIKAQGTDLSKGIQCAISSFSTRDDIGKALIIITDAEDHEQGAVESAKEANSMGINVFVLSVGTISGGTIPMPNGSTKHDKNGDEIITKLNEEIGKEIADAGDGVYINIDNSINAELQLKREISKLKKATYSLQSFGEGNEQFITIAIILLIIVIMDSCLTERKNSLFNTINLFK